MRLAIMFARTWPNEVFDFMVAMKCGFHRVYIGLLALSFVLTYCKAHIMTACTQFGFVYTEMFINVVPTYLNIW
jgi:hypothetical protein